ncbi:hypothetical protein Scep_024356 [Stephania cephalantha]|uniref:Uncharacterized protein n=1 Tax=Stephania cephalantha TaxID=152367 RepID=A0AAP0EWE5_9MAGN
MSEDVFDDINNLFNIAFNGKYLTCLAATRFPPFLFAFVFLFVFGSLESSSLYLDA